MINRESFSAEWIRNFKAEGIFPKIDLMILEKMIRALFLVEHLVNEGLDFVFKGGTSLILLLERPERFSIDVDIITMENKEKIFGLLDKVCENELFSKVEENIRQQHSNHIPKAHYKLFYISSINNRENYILLDVLFETNYYPEIIYKDIEAVFLNTSSDKTKVKVPSINSILGDKLTAFAPDTIGIRYNKSKEMEIIKQLFDIGILFDYATDITIVSEAYNDIAQKEIFYRDLDITIQDTLEDTIQTGLLIARREKNKEKDAEKFSEIVQGIRSFSSFLITKRFIIDDVIEATAKAALLAAKIKYDDFDNFVRPKTIDKSKIDIKHPNYNFLNKIKKLPNNAIFFWEKTISIIGSQ